MELSARYGKATRKRSETKWGFTGLISELSRSGEPCSEGLDGLVHDSHVQQRRQLVPR